MSRQNTTYVLAERPTADIVPGKTFQSKTAPAPTAADLKDGQMLVESLYLSLDPAMRGWLNDSRSYLPPVAIGETMRGSAITRVLASKSSRAQPGDLVVAGVGWTEVAIVDEKAAEPIGKLPAGSKVTDSLGPLGLTGLTAFFGLRKIGQPKAGDTVVVSGAAGATGSIVGQMAKLAGAKRVVGTAGTDEKCKWLTEELGFDVALNYKDPDFRKKFAEATPDFIDVFWDNVGGEQLELALGRAKFRARFVMCGSISGYNAPGKEAKGIRNLFNVTAQRIRMEGFIVFDFASEFAPAREEIRGWLAEGKLKRKETIIKGGLSNVETAWQKLFGGENMGKLLLEVKNPDESSKL